MHPSSQEENDDYVDPTKLTASIPLLPFDNQVGGHASLFRFSKRAICKPVCSKEKQFYEHLAQQHSPLLPFMCQYLGALNVTYHQQGLPEIHFDKNEPLLNEWKQCNQNKQNRRRQTLSLQEQVLQEVLSPQAIQERLRQVQQWQQEKLLRRQSQRESLPSIPSPPSSLPTMEDRHRRWFDTSHLHDEHTDFLGRSAPTTTLHPRLRQCRLVSTPDFISPHPFDLPRQPSSDLDESDTLFTMEDIPITTSPAALASSPSTQLLAPPSTCSSSSLTRPVPHSDAEWSTRQTPDNPWSLQVYQRDRQRMQQQHHRQDPVKQYIVLEDLTDGLRYPCVLDLKMGVRQYGVDATPAKVKSQSLKSLQSTSHSLGVRVCGMQVYDNVNQQFLFQDKYFGRTLTPDTFQSTLATYLDNGHGCQLAFIPIILDRLYRLADVIKSMDHYRFYTSSLLIIYDGDLDLLPPRKLDLRVIDFAHCMTQQDMVDHGHEFAYPPSHSGPDLGYLLGLRSLVHCFQSLYQLHGGHPDDLAQLAYTHVFDDLSF
ncbi:SAICAR synthase-like protein [Hesseltinella vesiculosa]|uniref:Kinase n=1 Tax=Hesseltinella vesiculosa TaxID=101127 RepID=A0A1X2G983_9FUNG|nr:SAICAR synthase-like protein [Hesseltinella vesiculosa]